MTLAAKAQLPSRRDYSRVLRIGFPVLLTQAGIIAVSFADTMMVGEYGTNELASAAFVNNIFFTLIATMIGFASGITPLVGAYFARRLNRSVGQTLRVALQLNFALALIFTLIMTVVYFNLHLFGQPDELLPLIRPYFIIVLCTLIPTALFNALQQTANGITDTALPMWIILGANILNIIGNYALIYGHWGAPELGLNGAGISTLSARILSLLVLGGIMLLSPRYRIYRRGLLSPLRAGTRRRRLFATSWPVMLQVGVECGLWGVGGVVCGWFGAVKLAAYQIIVTISQLGFMTYMSFAVAASVLVSNNLGLKDYHAMRRTATAGLHIILLLCTLVSLFLALFCHQLLPLFTSDEAVITSALTLIAPMIIYQFLDGTQINYANCLRGTGNVRPLLAVALISYVAVGIPSLLLFSVALNLQSVGIYISFNVALLVAAALQYLAFSRTLRKISSPTLR
ncbi:MAG: MATE family efflux transporter [Muribaculaceae bacterium]|nr:MATE family efflux transporter [Muribaculaceae bacterium]